MMNRIVYLGDIHGEIFRIEGVNRKLDNFSIVQVGDFGIGMISKQQEKLENLDQQLVKKNNTLYVIRGNHDNPNFWVDPPKFQNIYFIKDFSVVNIDGLSHLCIGGAISIDRKYRTLGYSYWENEGVPFIDPVRFDGLDIDVIITHTAPNVAPPTTGGDLVRHYAMNDVDLIRDLQLERNEVDKVFEKFKGEKPIKWVYGHFHDTFRSEVNNFRFYGLGVNELLDLI